MDGEMHVFRRELKVWTFGFFLFSFEGLKRTVVFHPLSEKRHLWGGGEGERKDKKMENIFKRVNEFCELRMEMDFQDLREKERRSHNIRVKRKERERMESWSEVIFEGIQKLDQKQQKSQGEKDRKMRESERASSSFSLSPSSSA